MTTPDDLQIPDDWEILAGADTGTFMSGLVGAIPPVDDPPIYVLEEFPNYHYVAGSIELLGISVREWIRAFGRRLQHYGGGKTVFAWVDRNTTFTSEIGEGLGFERNQIHLELRTEITREYFQQNRIWLAPWLRILPYELEHASWPEHETRGRYTRTKAKDHTLDCLEHICSRRPISSHEKGQGKPRFLDQYWAQHGGQRPRGTRDAHLGDA